MGVSRAAPSAASPSAGQTCDAAAASLEFFARPGGLFVSTTATNNGGGQTTTEPLALRGINWFGFESNQYCPHGLWAASMDSLLDTLETNGFNAVRFTFSADFALGLDTLVAKASALHNPALVGYTAGRMLDHVVAECRKRGMLVMLCMYRFSATDGEKIPELWYSDAYPESKVVQAWKCIAARYADSPNVFAYDLKNEPHGCATWGSGDPATDWSKAVERIGNAVHAINPKALIFAEGIDRRDKGGTTAWGGSLEGLRRYVPKLQIKDKLVFSPHVYGPDVVPTMDCFSPSVNNPSFPNNMPAVWEQEWSFCVKDDVAPFPLPLVVGEWGGRNEAGTQDRVWHEALVDYMTGVLGCTSAFYWALNANCGEDTKGLLGEDWKTVDEDKIAIISKLCPKPTKLDLGGDGGVVVTSVV